MPHLFIKQFQVLSTQSILEALLMHLNSFEQLGAAVSVVLLTPFNFGSGSATCGPGLFNCPGSYACVPKRWLCDGERDCPDGSDELAAAGCGTDFDLFNQRPLHVSVMLLGFICSAVTKAMFTLQALLLFSSFFFYFFWGVEAQIKSFFMMVCMQN